MLWYIFTIRVVRKRLELGREETKVSEEEKPRKKLRGRDFLGILALASELGFSIAIPIGLGVLAGSWLDKRLGTAPALTLILLLIGVVIGMANLYSLVRRTTKNK